MTSAAIYLKLGELVLMSAKKTYQQKYRQLHQLEKKTYMKKYRKLHLKERRQKLRKWRKEHPENCKQYEIKRRLQHCIREKQRRKEFPIEYKARQTAKRMISIKGQKCSICGVTKNIERHHPDYSKPLEVQFLCHECHTIFHYPKEVS